MTGLRRRFRAAAVAVAVFAGLATAAFTTAGSAAALGAASYNYLVARHDGKCLDVVGRSRVNSAHVQQYRCLGYNQTNQQFQLVQIAATGWFQIVARHDGKCLDVTGVSTANGALVQQYDCLGNNQYNQQFRFAQVSPGWYQIIARHSNKCLDITGVSSADGALLQQWDCLGAGQYNQQFAMHTDQLRLSGHAKVDKGAWHQESTVNLYVEVDANTSQEIRAYVLGTTSSSSDSPFGFKGHTVAQLSPSNVVTPGLPGVYTGADGWSAATYTWGGPGMTDVSLSVADGSSTLTPQSSFS